MSGSPPLQEISAASKPSCAQFRLMSQPVGYSAGLAGYLCNWLIVLVSVLPFFSLSRTLLFAASRMRINGRAGKTAMRDLDPSHIMQVGMGFFGSKALLSAVELGLFSALARKPMTASKWHQCSGFTRGPFLISRTPCSPLASWSEQATG